MSKKEQLTRPQEVNEPKTIKVSTVVVSVIVTVAIIASFIGGWFARSADQARVQSQASELVSSLKAGE